MQYGKWAVALAIGLATAACAGAGASARAPEGVDSSASQRLIGDPPDFAAEVRVDRIRGDAVYGPLLAEVSKDDALDAVLSRMSSVDLVGAFDGPKPTQVSLVLTLRGAPGIDELPASFRRALDEAGVQVLASGVREYPTLGEDGWPWTAYLAKHDWVVLGGRAVAHGHEWFASTSAPPPAVDFGDDALVGIWFGGAAMTSAAMADAAKQRGNIGLQSGRLVLRDGVHGDLRYDAVYDTAAHAEEAMRVTQDRIGMYALVWKKLVAECPALDLLTIDGSVGGRALHASVGNLPGTWRAARGCTGLRHLDHL